MIEKPTLLLTMAHQLHLDSVVPNDQTCPSLLPLLQATESIIFQSENDSTTTTKLDSWDQEHEDEIKLGQSRNEEITMASGQVGEAAEEEEEEEEEATKGCDEVLAVVAEESGRERLKKHRVEVAGRVWIPDIWGQEEFLKDWADCTTFDDTLFPTGIMSARSALVEEGRRGTSSRLRIENRC